MFSIIDGDARIFGVFDGHGPFAEQASRFASSAVLQYFRESSLFESKKL
jgi:serine/threonine protein phosphatase PrpC